ncbi:MAG: alkane 1-monooxygenase [Cryomorphaceae bacterium]|nr:MAG: alkane 1-monooxygenase [Cryomorphaceae bacterium]
MVTRAFRYLTVLIFPLVAFLSFEWKGWWLYSTVILAFGVIPAMELLFPPDPENISDEEEERFKDHWLFDVMIYLIVPFHFLLLIRFLFLVAFEPLQTFELIGAILAMGTFCGAFGINVAHELGHRKERAHRIVANLLLMTSLNAHFYVQHNRGHHRYVSTPIDPETAWFNESIYAFWWRTVVSGYVHAWRIQLDELRKRGDSFFSAKNDMLWFQSLQAILLVVIAVVFGWKALGAFAAAALMGILLLAIINYIEHYGLLRKEVAPGRYERVLPKHSWNSDHMLGRLILFELSRHSDHHYKASRKYQILMHHDDSPQMPTGYPGMMLLTLLPPAWFRVMNPRVKAVQP